MSTPTIERRQQSSGALQRANEVRLRRAQEKREIIDVYRREGPFAARAKLAADILECPWWLANARIDEVLLWVPRYQRKVVNRLLEQIGTRTALKTVGQLTPRQRRVIATELDLDAR